MQVLGILGSPRKKGNTHVLMEAVLDGAANAGANTELVSLSDLNMKFCVACGQCYKRGKCIHDDDVEKVKQKMLEADGIVLGSPNYMNGVSAQLKTVMDRCAAFVHCFLLEGKFGAAVATAGGSGQEEIAHFQNTFLQHCGARTVGICAALSAGTGQLADHELAISRGRQLGADLVAAIREHRSYPDQDKAHEEFFPRMKRLVETLGEDYPFQYEHWKKKGWL